MDIDLLLKNIAKHIVLSPSETELFVSLLQRKSLKRKEFLLRHGEVCKTENFILTGCLRVYTIDPNGFEHIVYFAVEDWWASDLLSFFTGSASAFFIDALEDTELLQISKTDLDRLYREVPKFERFFRIILQNAYAAQQQRINQNLSLPAEDRYLEFVQKYPSLEQRIPQKQIAAYLGITPVFLSMLKKKRSGK